MLDMAKGVMGTIMVLLAMCFMRNHICRVRVSRDKPMMIFDVRMNLNYLPTGDRHGWRKCRFLTAERLVKRRSSFLPVALLRHLIKPPTVFAGAMVRDTYSSFALDAFLTTNREAGPQSRGQDARDQTIRAIASSPRIRECHGRRRGAACRAQTIFADRRAQAEKCSCIFVTSTIHGGRKQRPYDKCASCAEYRKKIFQSKTEKEKTSAQVGKPTEFVGIPQAMARHKRHRDLSKVSCQGTTYIYITLRMPLYLLSGKENRKLMHFS